MKEMMVILDGSVFRTALRRVRRVFRANDFMLLPQHDGTITAIRHDVAVRQGIDKRVKILQKPCIHFCSFQELVGEALHRGFTHMSINEGDGWTTRTPINDVARGYIPRFWREFKFRFYRNTKGSWAESMTIYPSGNGFFHHVKELF